MKVKLNDREVHILSATELVRAKEMIEELREDTNLKSYVKSMVRIATGSNEEFEVLKATARVAKNSEGVGYYEDNSKIDVWCDAYAFNSFVGFVYLGFYLSDVWQIGNISNAEINNRMFVLHYKRQ